MASGIRPGFALTLALAAALGACGGNVVVDTATGGSPTSSSSSSSTSATSSSSTSSTSSTSTTSSSSTSTSTSSTSGSVCATAPAPPPSPCTPTSACKGFTSPCLAEVPQFSAPVFGLRMNHIQFLLPKAFSAGIVANTIEGNLTPNDGACHLNGTGTFSWLLKYDTQQGTLTTGGSKPPLVAGGSYTFVNESAPLGNGASIMVAPGVLKAPFAGCAIDAVGSSEVVVPIYLDVGGASAVYLPLRAIQFYKGYVSGDHSCIGTYNAAGLQPANACQPDASHQQFLDGGYVGGFIDLAEADKIPIQAVNQTLCVLLTGNAAQYGQQSGGTTVCKTGTTGILFQGDWCAATNGPATATCHDAVQLIASFSASGVKIN